MRGTMLKTIGGAVLAIVVASRSLPAADGPFQPLDQNTPPGVAGAWAAALGRATPAYRQPVRVSLPSKGSVTFYDTAAKRTHSSPAPAQARMGVGFVFRVRLSDMPEFPNKVVYPSIEIIDRLHPPRGKADTFPIPVEFTADEIRLALAGRMITKVVYLEQPQLAYPTEKPIPTATIQPWKNLLTEADRRGRPMAIVRIGSRQPDGEDDWGFFGRGGPLEVSK
ncbi:MAG: hypothetical protein ACE5KM_10965 [Planctomycetaceae bacterium]